MSVYALYDFRTVPMRAICVARDRASAQAIADALGLGEDALLHPFPAERAGHELADVPPLPRRAPSWRGDEDDDEDEDDGEVRP